jgi:hypothetical protein
MKILPHILFAQLLFVVFSPCVFSQTISLGLAENYAVYSTGGAVTNSGTVYQTRITGNVGTSSDPTLPGFGNIDGNLTTVANTAQNVLIDADVLDIYYQLNSSVSTFFPSAILGNNQQLVAGVYEVLSAASLNDTLYLDAQNDSNAVFILKINGALTANTASKVVLQNGALACRVFWKVEGLISCASGVSLKGTLLSNNAAIVLQIGNSIEGRILSIQGAITLTAATINLPIGCTNLILTGPIPPNLASAGCFAVFTALGAHTNSGISTIVGEVGTNGPSDVTLGFDVSNVDGEIHTYPDASTAQAAADLQLAYAYLVNLNPGDIELIRPDLFGHNLILSPHVYSMQAAVTFSDTLIFDAQGNSSAIFVININGAFSTLAHATMILRNGAQAKHIFWKIDGAVSISEHAIFQGVLLAYGAIHLSNGVQFYGNALTVNGAISIQEMAVSIPAPCAPNLDSTLIVQYACLGLSGLVVAHAQGTVASYQWQKDGVDVFDGSVFSGTQSDTLHILSVAPIHGGGTYTVTAIGTYGRVSVSQPISLFIDTVPSITVQPSNQSVTIGELVEFTVEASGSNLHYQWRIGTINLVNTGFVMGVTTPTLTIDPVENSNATDGYNVLVSGSCAPFILSNTVGFTLTTVNLPIELLDFSAICEDNTVSIQWETASEYNSNYFVVEKSTNGFNWEAIDTVAAAGNSTQIMRYSLEDNMIYATEINYYRLIQVDYDGTEKYYAPISCTCSSENSGGIMLFPNPAHETSILYFFCETDEQVTIQIRGVYGNLIQRIDRNCSAGMQFVPLSLDRLEAGIYNVSLTVNKRFYSFKFMLL